MLLCAELWALRGLLIKMTDEIPLLLAPRDQFVTLIYSIGNILSITLQERIGLRNVLIWLHRMDLSPIVFFTHGSLCGDRAGAGVFSDILNVRESYAFRLSCYGLSTRSICNFSVFGILHFGGHCQ
jgi:hypothetical protein